MEWEVQLNTLPKCLTGVRAEVDMVVVELKMVLLKAFPIVWKQPGPDCRELYVLGQDAHPLKQGRCTLWVVG